MDKHVFYFTQCVCLLTLLAPEVYTTNRHYFLAAVEVDWDYAPSGMNMVDNEYRNASDKLEQRIDRIGSRYRKAIFKGFTDASFMTEIPPPPWGGLLGPTIRAEVGDIVYIHFKNMASASNFSVHPHGLFYNKDSEGALYVDGSANDGVPPGGSKTYMWDVRHLHEPTKDDDNCVAWGYHSHIISPRDIDTGLLGFALTCRKGVLTPDGRRKDVDRELFLYADIANENQNWYFEENLSNCGDPLICKQLRDENNQAFIESNQKYHINGYTYGNLPDFPACEGENLVWYFMSLNLGLHTIHVNGQTMVIERKRTDTASLHAASFYSGYMTPINPGRWLIYCRNQYHFAAGMEAFLNVQHCPNSQFQMKRQMKPLSMRRYFLAIEEMVWDYAPNKKQTMVSENKFLKAGEQRIGSLYKKAVYTEYLDETFTIAKPRGVEALHEGLAGPPIKAEVGESVVVVVLNRASRPYSFLANGVSITKQNEGAFYKNHPHDHNPSGAIVNPGELRAYHFDVPVSSSPTKLDPDCITYVYHSAVDLQRDIYTGLFGPLVVCKSGKLAVNGVQKDVSREFFLNWMVIDENLSWYIDENIHAFTGQPWTVNKEDEQFRLSNRIRAINGRSFGTLEGLSMCLGDKVAWHMYGLGERFDHHHFSFDGNNFHHDGRRIDSASVFPGVGKTVIMVPDQAGHLLLRTGQLQYESEGMYAWYDVIICTDHKLSGSVIPPRIVPSIVGVVRRYYIAVVEGEWEYCPEKTDPVTGGSLWDPESVGYKFIRDGPTFVGSVYSKAIYREFTDHSFTQVKQRTQDETHLGILGPFIRANAGDTIEIVLKNMASHPYNLIPRNVVFSDGASISDAFPTMPGHVRMYSYVVPERSGPKHHEPNCVGSSYFSRVNPLNDTNSGLFGPLVICKPGVLDLLGQRTDKITKEFALSFAIIDENRSNYKQYNFKTRAPFRSESNYTDEEFVNSNMYYTMNGLIYGNLQGLNLHEGERTAWYIFGIGSRLGVHTAHFHGQLYLRSTSLALRRDVLEIFPGTYETVEMLGYNPGNWLLHCHVSTHTANGMKALFRVIPRYPVSPVTPEFQISNKQVLFDPTVGFPKMPAYNYLSAHL